VRFSRPGRHRDVSSERRANISPGDTAILERLDLDVPPGEVLALVGRSGAGKTTILKLVNRLLVPDAGQVIVEGRDTRQWEPIRLRRRIGYVLQEIGLFPHMNVADNIGLVPRLEKWPPERVAARVTELLDLIGLEPEQFAARWPDELSGGQRQRVGVARALAADPPVLLMDEPFGALDPLTRDAIGQDFRRLHDALGLTTVMITHDTLEAVLLADRIVVMRGGAVIADGTPRALMGEDADPYVRELMQTPRRQAERLQALITGRNPQGPGA
jgi:osmoprotectant transport system ATP-binding protein